MKFRNIFWGLILIIIGILFTLENLHFIDFDWYNLWRLWPVILVLWGISIIPVKNVIKVILVLIVLVGSISYMMQETVCWHDNDFSLSYDNDSNNLNQEFTIPYEDSVPAASLHMEVAASKFELLDESYDLLDFQKNGSLVDYKYTVKQLDSTVDINVYMDDEVSFKTHSHNKVGLSLNPQPVWDLDFEVGASNANFDVAGLKVSDVTIEGGAAAIKLRVGDKYPKTKINISTGASSIKVMIPKDSFCDLDINAVLSNKKISGFDKINSGHYQTDNSDKATNKIYIEVETAASSFSIIRY